MDNGLLHTWATRGLRLVLGLLFLYASYDKILHPQAFAQAVFNYQILPEAAVNLAALVLPWLELVLAVCLMLGVWLPGAAATATGLLAVFAGTLAFNLLRGLDVQCGCFSTDAAARPADWWTVARDLAFLGLGLALSALVFGRRSPRRREGPAAP